MQQDLHSHIQELLMGVAIDGGGISGPDSAKEGMEYALQRAELGTDPARIIGKLFRFWAFPNEDPVTILVGSITGIVIFGDSVILEVSISKIHMYVDVLGIERSNDSWNLLIVDENGEGNMPGRLEIL